METGKYYRDEELSLATLAEKLDIHPHELSRIVNVTLKKNFNDFVNEYRVKEVTKKMQEEKNEERLKEINELFKQISW